MSKQASTETAVRALILSTCARLARENVQPRRVLVGPGTLATLRDCLEFIRPSSLAAPLPEGCAGRIYGLWVYEVGEDEGVTDPNYLYVDDEQDAPPRPLGKQEVTFYALKAIKQQFEACAAAGTQPTRLVVSAPVLYGLKSTSLFKVPTPPRTSLPSGAAGLMNVDKRLVEVFEMRPGSYPVGAYRVEVSGVIPEEEPVWTDV